MYYNIRSVILDLIYSNCIYVPINFMSLSHFVSLCLYVPLYAHFMSLSHYPSEPPVTIILFCSLGSIFLLAPYLSGKLWYLSFHAWLIHSTKYPPVTSLLLQMTEFHSFYVWQIFQCAYVPHFLYTFICSCTLRLLPNLDCE